MFASVSESVFDCRKPGMFTTPMYTSASTPPIPSNINTAPTRTPFTTLFPVFFLFLLSFLCCPGLFSFTSFLPRHSLFSGRICLSISSDPLRPDSLFSLSASQFGHNPVVSSSLAPHFPQNLAMFLLPCFCFYSIFSSLFVSSISLKIVSESNLPLLNQYSLHL